MPLNIETYFSKDIEEREVQTLFNFSLINEQLPNVAIFTTEELEQLNSLQAEFQEHINSMSDNEYRKEMERLGIDLSWKSSQIEGNTYSLLEQLNVADVISILTRLKFDTSAQVS